MSTQIDDSISYDDNHYVCMFGFVCLGFMAYQPFRGYLMPKSFYTYILDIEDLVWLKFIAYQPLLVI